MDILPTLHGRTGDRHSVEQWASLGTCPHSRDSVPQEKNIEQNAPHKLLKSILTHVDCTREGLTLGQYCKSVVKVCYSVSSLLVCCEERLVSLHYQKVVMLDIVLID